MNVFTTIRRALWSLILALCIVVGGLYLAISQNFLSPSGLRTVASNAAISQTVRDEVVLPKVIAAAQNSQYASLLDKSSVTAAFNRAVPPEALSQKLVPAIDAVGAWLDSKQPDITFSVTTSDLSDKLVTELTHTASSKIASLPNCTYKNSLADVENAVCRSSLISQKTLDDTIANTLRREVSLNDATITPASVTVPSSVIRIGRDVPEYLNMLYAVSLIAAAVIALVSLWLLFKHRLSGIITMGAAAVLGAGALLSTSLLLKTEAVHLTDDTLSRGVIIAATNALQKTVQAEALYLVIGGAVAIVLASSIKIIIAKKRHPSQSLHLSKH